MTDAARDIQLIARTVLSNAVMEGVTIVDCRYCSAWCYWPGFQPGPEDPEGVPGGAELVHEADCPVMSARRVIERRVIESKGRTP